MHRFRTLDDLDVNGKTVLVRGDLNVPLNKQKIANTLRVERLVPTLKDLSKKGAKVVVLSHLGRPRNGHESLFSLSQVHPQLERMLDRPVRFVEDCIGPKAKKAIEAVKPSDFVLLENLRFHPGEEQNDQAFVEALAELGDIYVNDAFSCSHRAHASIEGLALRLPSAAGRLLEKEVTTLYHILKEQTRPTTAIIGGNKISTKIKTLWNLISKVDTLILGGGMATIFLVAMGKTVGSSYYESAFLDQVYALLDKARSVDCNVMLPLDVVVAQNLETAHTAQVVSADAVPKETMILDIGPATVHAIGDTFMDHTMVIWNGPLGAFERPPFDAGTITVAQKIATLTRNNDLISIAGGGDTIAALVKSGVLSDFTYVSLAGGAFLEWFEGKKLPGLSALSSVHDKTAAPKRGWPSL